MVSPYCVEPASGGEWHASVGDTNRAPLPLAGVPACPTSSVYDRHNDLVPRGTGSKAYARRLGTKQKAHRGEKCAAVGGRTLSGGVRSSIRTPPPFGTMLYPPHHAVNLVETAREMNGQPAGNRLSGVRYAADLGHMHGLNTMLRLFSPAAVSAGVKMGYQSIQHVEYAFRKHRTLALFALTHRSSFSIRASSYKAPIRFFQRAKQVFCRFKAGKRSRSLT